jgi:fatty-acyl-CoA synthase
VETTAGPDRAAALAESARERVRDHLGLSEVEVVPVAPATIPHTTSGKVRRQAALQLYLTSRESRPVPEGDPR